MDQLETHLSHTFLRKTLGYLGIWLPFTLWLFNFFELQPSISHYYYTQANVLFTGTLCAFGLFLWSYRGYEPKPGEISDNILTNIAGILAIITAFVPTEFNGDLNDANAANAHNNSCINVVHLISAGGFFFLMGHMALFKFTKSYEEHSQNNKMGAQSLNRLKNKDRIYRFCGGAVWFVLGALLVLMIIRESKHEDFALSPYEVLIGETIALMAFGTAWLTKGKV